MPREPDGLPASVPRWGNAVTSSIGWAVLRLFGWRNELKLPDIPRFVIIGAPHTTNWDFVFTLAVILALRVRIHFWMKHTAFRPPWGRLLKWLGGIPINRKAPGGIVGQTVDAFRSEEQFILAIAPEGTRALAPKWKRGFYQVAVAAQVPIVLGYMDYRRKAIGSGPVLVPTGDYEADLRKMAEFYSTVTARYPDQFAIG